MTDSELHKALTRVKGTVELSPAGSIMVFLSALTLLIGALTQHLMPIVVATLFVMASVVEFLSSAITLSGLRRGSIALRTSEDLLDREFQARQVYETSFEIVRSRTPIFRTSVELRPIASNHVRSETTTHERLASGLTEMVTVQFSSERPSHQCFHGLELCVSGWLGLTRCVGYLPLHRPMIFTQSDDDWVDVERAQFAGSPRRDGMVRSENNGGFGLTRELREYRAGDPVRRIAWKQYARFGRPLVRELEHEVGIRTLVGIDCTALSSEDTTNEAAGRLFASFIAELRGAAGEGNRVDVVGLWPGSKARPSLHVVPVLPRQLVRPSEDFVEALLGQLMRPREVPPRALLARLAEVLYRYERLDFRTRELQDSGASNPGFDDIDAIDENLLVKWVAREIGPYAERIGANASASRRGWVELAWLHWGLALDRRRAEPVGLDGLVTSLEHAIEGRSRVDRVVYLTTSFERVPSRDIERLALSEKARGIDVELVLVGDQGSGVADFGKPYDAIAEWLIHRSSQAVSDKMDELNISTRIPNR